MGSVPNMIRSLVVVLAVVAVLILMVPRVSSVNRPPVDVHTNAVAVAAETGWAIEEPRGLPPGWDATSVRFVRSTDGLQTWHAGYVTPTGHYVAIEQTMNATAHWVEAETNRAPKVGQTTAGGRTWTEYDRPDKTQNSLVHLAGSGGSAAGLTTVITGTGTFEELAVFADHLRVLSRSS